MLRLFLVFYLLGLSSSIFPQDNMPRVIEFTKKDLKKAPSTLSSVADRISFVKLETLRHVLIGKASLYSCFQIPNGFIIYSYEFDEDVMLFNSQGKFITKVGRRGKGPGEYQNHYRVHYDKFNNQILIHNLGQVLIFSSEGKWLQTVAIQKGDLFLHNLLVFDKTHWMFTYQKPLEGEYSEVGVVKTDHNGLVIKQFDLTDKSQPGCYGNSPKNRNILYRSGQDVWFSYFMNSKTLRLTSEDVWEVAFILKSPIPEGPIELYSSREVMKQNEFLRENGQILSLIVYPKWVKIYGATPYLFNLLIDIKSGEKHFWSEQMEFDLPGLKDDLAGGPPFDIRSINDNNNAIIMMDASEFLETRDKGLLGKVFKDPGALKEMNDILDKTKPNDNPIIRIVHVK